jgi:hypothetical protein
MIFSFMAMLLLTPLFILAIGFLLFFIIEKKGEKYERNGY